MTDNVQCSRHLTWHHPSLVCSRCVEEQNRPAYPPMSVGHLLVNAAKTYSERNTTYGNNYKESFPRVMMALFPDGADIAREEDWAKMGVFVQVVSKLTRYAEQWPAGHADSAHDMIVYSAMLQELTEIDNGKTKTEG
jgi:hypothetical protein